MDHTKKPRVLVIHTGGTIGMRKNPETGSYEPAKGHLKTLIDGMPEIRDAVDPVPLHDLIETDELLDSSAMEPKHWSEIAGHICDCPEYDGFVVLHGTDTMSYTASALSFLLEELDRPVVFTGAQIPLMEPRNDAREHLITAMILAAHYHCPEVMLYFRGKLMRGNRTTKIDADGYDGFDSPNIHPLRTVGARLELDEGPPARARPAAPITASGLLRGDLESFPIASFRLYPGVDPEPIRRMVPDDDKAFGLILECFGSGNGPEKRLRSTLEYLVDAGVVVVNVTQCLRGTVNLKLYAAGSWMDKIGVTSGLDMTPEAAMTKLFYLFQTHRTRGDADWVREAMMKDLRGELTEPR